LLDFLEDIRGHCLHSALYGGEGERVNQRNAASMLLHRKDDRPGSPAPGRNDPDVPSENLVLP
jgi:hypothetical protein